MEEQEKSLCYKVLLNPEVGHSDAEQDQHQHPDRGHHCKRRRKVREEFRVL